MYTSFSWKCLPLKYTLKDLLLQRDRYFSSKSTGTLVMNAHCTSTSTLGHNIYVRLNLAMYKENAEILHCKTNVTHCMDWVWVWERERVRNKLPKWMSKTRRGRQWECCGRFAIFMTVWPRHFWSLHFASNLVALVVCLSINNTSMGNILKLIIILHIDMHVHCDT